MTFPLIQTRLFIPSYNNLLFRPHLLKTLLKAILIDYHTQDFVDVIHQMEPNGLDFVFDGMGGEDSSRGMAVLKRGGKLVTYAAPVGLGSLLVGGW